MPENNLFTEGLANEEVNETIRASKWKPAELGGLECKKVFPYRREWNEIYYNEKEVRPIFVEEENEIIVITIYTYFF